MENGSSSLLSKLCALLDEGGEAGSRLSPSVYDTAQLLRYDPPAEPRPLLEWLLAQQRDDGGWGAPEVPLARDVPTLAAILALHQARPASQAARLAVWRGLRFLVRHGGCWGRPLPDDLPLGAELILPALLEDAKQQGLPVPHQLYGPLRVLGSARRHLLSRISAAPGSAAHAWEAWGEQPLSELLDGSGGVGHSPAATARWLRLARAAGAESADVERAVAYLARAAQATPERTPGIVPTVWPINRFEQSWVLYALMSADLLRHPALRFRAHAQLGDLGRALSGGLGLSDHSDPDGDITARAMAALAYAGQPVDAALIRRLQHGDRFSSSAQELRPAPGSTAHAILALALLGHDVAEQVRFLCSRQTADGRWAGDKSHGSWLFTTSQALMALAQLGPCEALCRGVMALILAQRADGGWGSGGCSTPAETAYVVHALHAARTLPLFDEAVQSALHRAQRWLLYSADMPAEAHGTAWLRKELYCPYRVDQAFVLSALVAMELDQPEHDEHLAIRTRRCI